MCEYERYPECVNIHDVFNLLKKTKCNDKSAALILKHGQVHDIYLKI